MKSYLLVLVEHIIGFIYLVCFILGFINSHELLLFSGGLGMFLFMTVMILDNQSQQASFMFALVIGSIVGAFISKWYLGFFWISALFTLGQIPGFFRILTNKNQLISQIESTQKNLGIPQISIKEIIWFFILLFMPVPITQLIIL